MVEPEKGVDADRLATEAVDCVGLFVRLEITHARDPRGDLAAKEGDATDIAGLEDVLRLIEADFRQLTVPLAGKVGADPAVSEVLPPQKSTCTLEELAVRKDWGHVPIPRLSKT